MNKRQAYNKMMIQKLSIPQKKKYIDLFRVIGMLLVMFGHFVGTGAYAYDIPNVINGTLEHTILNSDIFFLLKIDGFLYYQMGVQAACLGVVIFFISTGYLVAGMMKRYTPVEFLVNRLFRVIPCLAVCVLFNGLLLSFAQGFHFSAVQYLTSMTGTWSIFRINPIMSVLWTLEIEMVFYIIAALIRQFDYTRIIGVYAIILLFYGLRMEFPDSYLLQRLTYNGSFIGICLLGSVIWFSENRQSRNNENKGFEDSPGGWAEEYRIFGPAFLSLAVNVMLFKLYQSVFGDSTTYPHVFTHVVPLILFLLLRSIEVKKPEALSRIIVIGWLSSLVFTVYLTHVVVGFNTMYFLQNFGWNRYLLLISAVIISLIVGWVLMMIAEKPSIKLCKKMIRIIREKKVERRTV